MPLPDTLLKITPEEPKKPGPVYTPAPGSTMLEQVDSNAESIRRGVDPGTSVVLESVDRQAQVIRQNEQAKRDAMYGIPLSDADYGIIRDGIANSANPDEERWNWGSALMYSQRLGIDVATAKQNLEGISQAWLMSPGAARGKSHFEAISDSFRVGDMTMDAANLAKQWKDSGGVDQQLEKQIDAIYGEMSKLQDRFPRNVVVEAMKLGAGSAPFMTQVLGKGAMAGMAATAAVATGVAAMGGTAATFGLGAPVGAVAMSAAMIAAASRTGSFMASMQLMSALDYYDMRKKGVSHEIANPMATISGGVQAALESFLGNVPGLIGKVGGKTITGISGNIAKGLLISGKSGALATSLMGYGGELLEEGAEEALQSISSDVIKNIAMGLEDGGLEQTEASEIATNAWENFKGGALASLGYGLPGAFIGYKGAARQSKALKEYAGMTDRETFIEQAGKWKDVESVPEVQRKAALGKIWEQAQQKAKEERQAVPQGEQKPITRTESGGLYTEETTVSSAEEDKVEAILKVGDAETKERYGYLRYEVTEDGIVLKSAPFKKGYESARDEAILDLAAKYPGLPITVSEGATDATRAAVERLTAANPKGTGANWYSEGEDKNVAQARAKLRLAISDKMPNVSASQREAAILIHEFRANAMGVKFDDYLKNEFSSEIIGTNMDRVSAAQGQRAGILFTKDGQELKIGEFVRDAKALVMVTEKSDFVSFVHESGHLFRKQLIGTDLGKNLDDAYKIVGGQWTREHEERFVDDLVKYLSYGEVKDEKLRGVFAKIAEWITRLWGKVLKQADVDPRIRAVMDELFRSDGSPLSEMAQTAAIAKEGQGGASEAETDAEYGEASERPNAVKQGGKEEVLFQTSTPTDKAQKIFDAVIDYQGATDDINEAGFVLPDGRMVDLSGRVEDSDYKKKGDRLKIEGVDYLKGKRLQAHSDVRWEGSPQGARGYLVRQGAIRIDAKYGIIELDNAPTYEQAAILRKLYDGKEIAIEAHDKGREADIRTDDPKRAMGQLRRFYDGEEVGTTLFQPESVDDAKERMLAEVGSMPIKNRATGIEATVSRASASKMASGSAVKKSVSPQIHALALANLKRLFETAVEGWEKEDRARDANIKGIVRFFSELRTVDHAYLVKLTVKKLINPKGNIIYSLEAVDINNGPAGLLEVADIDGIDLTASPLTGPLKNILQNINEYNNKSTILFQPSPPTDSEAFKKWFGDSKVVDAEGKPLVVYHGSGVADIQAFDISRYESIQTGDWGRGVYFTPSKFMADGYRLGAAQIQDPGVEAAYRANEDRAKEYGTTPMMVWLDLRSGKISQAQYDELKALEAKWRSELARVDKSTSGMVYPVYLSIKNPLVYTYVGITEPHLADEALSGGYDGVFVQNEEGTLEEIIAFNPAQIKSINNRGTWDASDPRILFQLDEDFAALRKEWNDQGVALDIYPGARTRSASVTIKVQKEKRGMGLATRALGSAIQLADKHGIRLELTPTAEWGASKPRLIEFYKRFGFIENKGQNKDYRISETMYREPLTVLYQLDEEAIDAEAATYESWQEWKEYVEQYAIPVFGEDRRAPEGEDTGRWYKDRWEKVHGRQEEEKAAGRVKERREARRGEFAAKMAKAGGVESLLSSIWDAEVQAFDQGQAMDEQEQEQIEKSYQWKQELARRLGDHPLVLLSAQSVGNGKKLKPSTRKAILTYIRNNEVEFAALYAELTGDLDMAQYAEAGREKLQSIPDPKLDRFADMSIAERTALLNSITDKEVRDRIKAGEYDDPYLDDYVRRLEEEKKTLTKQAADAEEEIRKLGGELAAEEDFARNMMRRADLVKKELRDSGKELGQAKESKARLEASRAAYVEALGSARDESKLSVRLAKRELVAALNDARKEARMQARFVTAEIRATAKLKQHRDALRKYIMKKPSRQIIWDKRQQILTIQEYLRSKKWEWIEEDDELGEPRKRRAFDIITDADGTQRKVPRHTTVQAENLKAALSMLLRESPTLGKMLTNDMVDRINEKPVTAWTVDELQDLREIIDRIAKQGRMEYQQKTAAEEMDKSDARHAANKTVRKTKWFKAPFGHGSQEQKDLMRKMEKRNVLDIPFLNMRRFASIYMDGGTDGANTGLLVHEERERYADKVGQMDRRLKKVFTRMRELKMADKDFREKVTIGGVGPGATDYTVTRGDLMAVRLALRDRDAKSAYIFGNLFSEEERRTLGPDVLKSLGNEKLAKMNAAIEGSLTDGMKELADMIGEDFDKEFDRLNKAVISLTNQEMKKVAHYFPIHREGAYFDKFGDSIMEELKTKYGMMNLPDSGFTLERIKIGASHQTPIKLDLFGTWQQAVERQEHLVAYGTYLKKLNAVYKSRRAGGVREAIIQSFGKSGMDYIDQYISEVANPHEFKKPEEGDRAVRLLRGNMAIGFLSFRWASIMKQIITSPLPYMAYAPKGTSANAFKCLASGNPMKWLGEIEAMSPMLSHRTADQIFESIKNMGREGFEGFTKKIGDIGMKGLEYADRFSVAIGWKGVYDEAIAKGMEHEEAVRKADDITLKTQPSARGVDLAPIFRGKNEWKQLLLQFGSALNVVYQNIRYDLPQAMREKEYGRAVGIATSYAIAGILLGAFAKARGNDKPDDDEAWWRDWVFYSTTQFTDSIPIIGNEVTSFMKRRIAGDRRRFGESELLPAVESLLSGADNLLEGDILASIEEIGTGLGLGLGLPVLALKEYIEFLISLVGGEGE